MFLLRKGGPEEFKAPLKPRKEDVKVEIIEDTSEAITKALTAKTEPMVKSILSNVKNDEKFFKEFMMFLERTLTIRDILLSIVKRALIETSMKIYSNV